MRPLVALLALLALACAGPAKETDDTTGGTTDPGTTPSAPHEGDDAGECSDAADNDRDGDFDCDDADCAGSPDCEGDTTVDDSGGRPCDTTLLSVEPLDGSTDVDPAAPLVVTFDAPPDDASFALTGGDGDPVALTETWEGATATLRGDLLAATHYTLEVSVCDLVVTSEFVTSVSDYDPGLVDGRVYVTRLSEMTITTPSFMDAIAGSYLTMPLLIAVEAGATLDLYVVGAGRNDAGDYTAMPGADPWDADPVSFATAPAFETDRTTGGAVYYSDMAMPIDDLVVSGTFSADGGAIDDLVLAGLFDTRDMGALVGRDGDPDAICDIAAAAGTSCVACADGDAYCLDFAAEGEATWSPNATY